MEWSGIYMGYVVLLGIVGVLLDKNRWCCCSRGSRSRLLPFAAAVGAGNCVECMWDAVSPGAVVGGVIFSLCGIWPLKAISSMPRARLTKEDFWPLTTAMAAFAAFFVVLYSMCDHITAMCYPYSAPELVIGTAYFGGSLCGVALGVYTGVGSQQGEGEGDEDQVPELTATVHAGVPEDEFNKLPRFTVAEISGTEGCGDISACSVCLNSFSDDSVVVQLPRCKHVFCTECLRAWLLQHDSCPLCKQVVSMTRTQEEP